jgi:hypothetical protein
MWKPKTNKTNKTNKTKRTPNQGFLGMSEKTEKQMAAEVKILLNSKTMRDHREKNKAKKQEWANKQARKWNSNCTKCGKEL